MTIIDELLDIMRSLRDPDAGCPWDLEQDFASIVPHTIEEAYEVADCIERCRLDELPAELGDLLFQVVFYAQLGAEQGRFDFTDVCEVLKRKLITRHPHVFADQEFATDEQRGRHWESCKAHEREKSYGPDAGSLVGVPAGLPALTRAVKLQKRAAGVGFDWPNSDGVKAKVREEYQEIETAIAAGADPQEIEAEIGDLLFACVNWARHQNIDPEAALRAANRKFERRFSYIEQALKQRGTSLDGASLAIMDALWEAAKVRKKKRAPKHP